MLKLQKLKRNINLHRDIRNCLNHSYFTPFLDPVISHDLNIAF